MHRDEMWQVFAPNGEPIPGASWASALNNPEVTGADVIVGAVLVFLYRRTKTGELQLLWQKRSDKVDRYPGDYDVSAGGHINLGESLTDAAIREMHEEIGVRISADDLNFVMMKKINKIFAWVYVVDWTGRDDAFEFNDEEASEVRWVPWSETESFRKSFAKAPLKREKFAFGLLEEWFERHGEIVSGLNGNI